MVNKFPGSIRCKKPKFSEHRGRTWDQCDVIDTNGEHLVGYLDTTWGSCFYFNDGLGWRKARHFEFESDLNENVFDFRRKHAKQT